MNISENLSQQELKEILMDICRKGNEAVHINLKDVIEDIKQQILEKDYAAPTGVIKVEASI